MSRNFDDFVLWLREEPEYRDRKRKLMAEYARKLENGKFESKADVLLSIADFAEELSEIDLRMYHKWMGFGA